MICMKQNIFSFEKLIESINALCGGKHWQLLNTKEFVYIVASFIYKAN
jgi:hypothetical protein